MSGSCAVGSSCRETTVEAINSVVAPFRDKNGTISKRSEQDKTKIAARAFAQAQADGQVDAFEKDALLALATEMGPKSAAGKALQKKVAELSTPIASESLSVTRMRNAVANRLTQKTPLTEEQRYTAAVTLYQIAGCDGVIDPDERLVMQELSGRFNSRLGIFLAIIDPKPGDLDKVSGMVGYADEFVRARGTTLSGLSLKDKSALFDTLVTRTFADGEMSDAEREILTAYNKTLGGVTSASLETAARVQSILDHLASLQIPKADDVEAVLRFADAALNDMASIQKIVNDCTPEQKLALGRAILLTMPLTTELFAYFAPDMPRRQERLAYAIDYTLKCLHQQP